MRTWLKEARNQKGISQKQAAKIIGISQSYYAALETGVRGKNIPGSLAKKIAQTFNFDWRLFYEDGEQAK